MEFLSNFVDIFLHIDEHLTEVVRNYGTWAYAILFAIIFCETGLVITPFLPGDSLLFAAGSMAATGAFNPIFLLVLLCLAAIIGDSVNFALGSYFGLKAFKPGNRILKPQFLDKTEKFYEKHGGKTIVLARFVPIVRTFAPFVAGAGRMEYSHFLLYNVLGGVLWIVLFVMGGYLFGSIPVVQENFGLVIVAIILVSVMPMVLEIIRSRREAGSAAGKA
jgi:membrane-associated protein